MCDLCGQDPCRYTGARYGNEVEFEHCGSVEQLKRNLALLEKYSPLAAVNQTSEVKLISEEQLPLGEAPK